MDRLEAATSRLEDIATSVDGTEKGGLNGAAGVHGDTAAATESTTTLTPAPETKVPDEPLPRSIEEFNPLIDNEVKDFVEKASKIGGLVEEQVLDKTKVISK